MAASRRGLHHRQGLSGLSTLSLTSFVAVAAIIAGAGWRYSSGSMSVWHEWRDLRRWPRIDEADLESAASAVCAGSYGDAAYGICAARVAVIGGRRVCAEVLAAASPS